MSDEEAILSLAACVKEHRNPYRRKGGPQPHIGRQLGRLLFNRSRDFPLAMFVSFLGIAVLFGFVIVSVISALLFVINILINTEMINSLQRFEDLSFH